MVLMRKVWLTVVSIVLAPFVAAVLLELFSLLLRPISLSFRFYGNLYGAYPKLMGWIFPIPSLLALSIAGGILLVSGLLLFVVARFRS